MLEFARPRNEGRCQTDQMASINYLMYPAQDFRPPYVYSSGRLALTGGPL